MKNNAAILICLFSAVLLTLGYVNLNAQPAQSPSKKVQKFEHLAMPHQGSKLDRELSKQIVKLSNEGWEMVDVESVNKDGTTVQMIYYFKRQR